MKLYHIFTCLGLAITLSGCASRPEPEKYEIESEKFYQRGVDGGRTEFVFIVTVVDQHQAKPALGPSQSEAMTRKEMQKMQEIERFEDSPALKIKLEDEAVKRLKKALLDRQVCRQGHTIDQVFWRDRSVQLRGGCYE
ncbi:putative orphan protein; putative signal peptide [Pseudoalteromonas luteoviolacea B = ATCC 29581]|nr:putative orphan protein; putative signal peptide [Pseudoalteromonas luteoviolacea B = ATCC 29581]